MNGNAQQRWRRGLSLGGKILVSAALLLYLATRIDFAAITRAVLNADRTTLAVAALLFLASNLLGAIQWRALLQASGIRLSLIRVLVYYLQGLFFGLFLPASVGADVSRVYDATKHSGEFGGSVAATVMDRLVGLYSIGMMAVVALLITLENLPVPILAPIVGFAVVNLAVCLALFSRRASNVLRGLARRFPKRRVSDALVGLVDALHGLRRRPGLLVWVFGLSLVVQVLRIFVHYQVALAMGISLPLRTFFVIIPILAVLVALPISFGGIGIRESAAVTLFGQVGLPATEAVAMQVAAFVLAIVVNLPGWFIFVARQFRAKRSDAVQPSAERTSGRSAGWRLG